jgi:hypothetical protein
LAISNDRSPLYGAYTKAFSAGSSLADTDPNYAFATANAEQRKQLAILYGTSYTPDGAKTNGVSTAASGTDITKLSATQQVLQAAGNQPIAAPIKDLQDKISTLNTNDLNVKAQQVIIDGTDLKDTLNALALTRVGVGKDQFTAALAQQPNGWDTQEKIDDDNTIIVGDRNALLHVPKMLRNPSSYTDPLNAEISAKTKDRDALQQTIDDNHKKLVDSIASLQSILDDAIKKAQDNPVQVDVEKKLQLQLDIVNKNNQNGLTDAQKKQIYDLFDQLLSENVKPSAIQPAPPRS